MNPRISVIIPVYNGAATVADTLKALLAQMGVREPMEVLVVDNISTDNTVEIVRQFPVTLLKETRVGPSAARNAGLAAARGEIIVCLDADTLPTRRWLAELIKPLEDPAVMLVGGAVMTYNPQSAAERYLDASGIFDAKHNVKAEVFAFAVGMNMAARATALREVGGWEEAFRWGEDIDISHRIQLRHPGSMAYAERAVMFHRNRPTLEGMTHQAFGYGRGAAVVFRRFPETAGWRWYSPMVIVFCIVGRWMAAGLAGAARGMRLMEGTRAELYYCHALWNWSFWRGFCHEYYRGGTEGRG